jgi:signal transduction histidine kinase
MAEAMSGRRSGKEPRPSEVRTRAGVRAGKPRGPLPERAKTDDSLRAERLDTDGALKGDVASAERSADEVVDQAREVADAVLSDARLKEDEASPLPAEQPAKADALLDERAEADHVVRVERERADVALDSDRKEQADTLATLLVHERAATDAYLLTERDRADDAVAHRDDFLGMVAHDVRNLLNGVVLNLGLLRAGDGEPEPHVAAVADRIQRYVGRMNRLIDDLVDVTSIDAGKLAIVPVEGDAVALLTEATETFQAAAREKGVSLSAEVPAAPLRAPFDHDRLLQVFANLIANAIKFTPSGGHIVVRVESPRGLIRFCVSDTGVGIPAPMLEAIFERFWQAGENDRRGMGLGLYISKSIVDAHQGRIWAESEMGKGTRVYFTLPVGAQKRVSPGRDPVRGHARPARRGKGTADRRRRK